MGGSPCCAKGRWTRSPSTSPQPGPVRPWSGSRGLRHRVHRAAHPSRVTGLVGDRPICLALDADPAGRHATDTAWRRLTDTGARQVTVAILPTGADPADLLTTRHEDDLVDLIRAARPAAQVVCDHTLDGVDMEGNPARRLAGFRQLLHDTTRVPADQRVDHILYLAHWLDIDPTAAADEAAANIPTLFADRAADRIVDHCHQLARQLEPPSRPGLHDEAAKAHISTTARRLP